MIRVARCLAALLLPSLGACATVPPRIPYDRANDDIRSITLVTPAARDKPTLFSLAPVTPLAMLGPLGAGADSSIQQSRADHFAALLASHNFAPRPLFVAALAKALEADGYQVHVVEVARPELAYLPQLPPGASTGDDAYLDILIANYGYIAGTLSDPYHPVFGVQYRLVRSSDNKVLMRDAFGCKPFGTTPCQLDAFNFAHYGDFDADPERASKGVTAALDETANAIGAALK